MEESGDFDISDRDLEDALNLNKRRKKTTKEEQIYGIWAENSDDSPTHQFTKGKRVNTRRNLQRTQTFSPASKNEFGSWEKHTTGFGSKMLEKMGFKHGQGLGKKGSGITEPIQAIPRQGRASLGAYASDKAEPSITSEPEQIEKTPKIIEKEKKKTWKLDEKTNRKYIRKSYNDLVKEVDNSSIILSDSTKVVDMTSAETKVSYGYDTIKTLSKLPDSTKSKLLYIKLALHFSLPQLTQIVEILIKTSENALKSHIKKFFLLEFRSKIISDILSSFEQEKLSLCNSINDISSDIADLSHLSLLLHDFEVVILDEQDLFKKALFFMHNFPSFFSNKFVDFKIEGLIGSYFYPILFDILKSWDLFGDSVLVFDVFKKWRECLHLTFPEYHDNFISSQGDELYNLTIHDLWLPRFGEYLSEYDLTSYAPLILFFNQWKPLLTDTAWIKSKKILFECLMSHLQDFDPSIHSYDFGWLTNYEELVEDMEAAYKIILRKVIKSLQNWHPSDQSVNDLIVPLTNIFNKDQFQVFLSRAIIPRLFECLDKELIINPRNQILDPFMLVMSWKNCIGKKDLATLFSRGFSMKWLKILHLWLSQDPNYEDVRKWYSGWKSLFVDIIDEPPLKHTFSQALKMIDCSIKGLPLDLPTPYTPPVSVPSISTKPQRISLSFKEIIQTTASEHCIIFTPTPRNRPDGKVIYRFGSNHIYVDRGVIFLETKGAAQRWTPISLADLVSSSVET